MNRFYVQNLRLNSNGQVPNSALGTVAITDIQDIKHISKVLRMTLGDELEICDGCGSEFLGRITAIETNTIQIDLIEAVAQSRELPAQVTLFQGITKGQKWDYLIQKSVEAGIQHIYPVAMVRSVSKISDEKADKKTDRWQKIADEAAKQCKRSVLPVFQNPLSFKEALVMQDQYDLIIVAYEGEIHHKISTFSPLVKEAKRIALWVGPEGGIDKTEIQQLSQLAKVNVVTLGRRILRTETAPVVLLAQLSYILE